ncbi:cytochrome P450 [Nocardia macrotermitis]|uniref:Putative cytochrome P450 YjiB n=1 Tax=Nocardia macrotermitis TaxID=2585198 RepID=A0A7K0DEQ4_9NOCA|nr:cytochrome P450 [Nocardia macrotermitis]MQY24119.1 putative cytochrome P450 YjiB [Nocardia macrotermitis]
MDSPIADPAAQTGDTLELRDPYPYFAARRREGGVFHGTVMDYSRTPESLRPKDTYAAVSYSAVSSALRNNRVFSSALYDSTIGVFMGPTILAMHGARHKAHRALVTTAFKPQSLMRWEPEIVRSICDALIDEFAERGRADLIREFTFEFPTRVIARLLGLPEADLPFFREAAVAIISYADKVPRAMRASVDLKDYFVEQIEQRRRTPTEDIIGDLVAAEIDGEKLSEEAIYSFLRLLLPAGLETTYRSSGNLLYLLLSHPEQFEAVRRDRDLIGPAVEEGLRYETPLTLVQRYVTEDTELEGTAIPRGAVLDVCLGSANRDENRWERPEEFDIFRKHVPHISFTAGAHTCLGLHLARMETRVALHCLLDRLTDFTLLAEGDPHIFGQPFRSPNSLPVTFDVLR